MICQTFPLQSVRSCLRYHAAAAKRRDVFRRVWQCYDPEAADTLITTMHDAALCCGLLAHYHQLKGTPHHG